MFTNPERYLFNISDLAFIIYCNSNVQNASYSCNASAMLEMAVLGNHFVKINTQQQTRNCQEN